VTSTDRHIPFAQLVDLVEDRLGAEEQRQARAHASSCGRCGADLAWLEQVIALMRTDDSIDLPAHVVGRAVGLFRSRPPPERSALRRRLRAALRFDSASAAPTLRSRVSLERQLMFNAEGFNLDLRVRPEGRMWLISGQVFGALEGGQVELDGATGTTRTDLNALYEFKLPPIPAGSYNLTLRLGSIDVQIAGLEIGV
jgi:hypothetical protein